MAMSADHPEPNTTPASNGQKADSALGSMYVLAVLLLCAGAIVIVALMFVPSDWKEIFSDPEEVYVPGSTPGFEPLAQPAGLSDPPGVTLLERGHYRVVIEAYNWEFNPKEIRLPVGAEVNIVARSSQDYHGIAIVSTDIVLQLFQNQVAQASFTFTEAGEYPFVCAEYCGAGHINMTGKIIVE